MSLNTNQMTAEERKKNREKFMIKDKENETIYRHYGDLNGADFKLRKNKNCEIYILDWSKGMYIDDCEDCKIFCGPIDGSVFIRGSKNCEFSIIARQVRFRNCENLKVFTYCPSDPAVESSFNIYFAPFNAFFPHLKELFVKGEFKKEEKNHIDTPYDFTPGEELGGGAAHHLQLSENEFFIKVINDGDEPVEEMFDGYSQEEPWIQNKASELPNFEQKGNNDNNNNDNGFNFMDDNNNDNKNDNQKTNFFVNLANIFKDLFGDKHKNIEANDDLSDKQSNNSNKILENLKRPMLRRLLTKEKSNKNRLNSSKNESKNSDKLNLFKEEEKEIYFDEILNFKISENNDENLTKLVSAIPAFIVKEQNKNKDSNNKYCPICLGEFMIGEKESSLPCLHCFHSNCIEKWLKRSKFCPVCKLTISWESLNPKF